MEAVKPQFIGQAIWSSGLRTVFTAYLLFLAWTAVDRNFVIAGAVFLVFAVCLAVLAYRKFSDELTRMRYAEMATQKIN